MKLVVVLPFSDRPALARTVHVSALPTIGATIRFNVVTDYEDEAVVESVEVRAGQKRAPAIAAEVWLATEYAVDADEHRRLIRRGWKVRRSGD